jgi:hypothetical protein
MRLKDHILISDFSLRLDSVITHYKWDLDEIAFSSEERIISTCWLEILGSKNVGPFMFNSICQDIIIERCSSSWKFLFSIIGVLIAVILAKAGTYLIWLWYLITLKARILNILMQMLLEPIILMIQPPPPASATNQWPLLKPVH